MEAPWIDGPPEDPEGYERWQMEREIARLRAALEWYEERVRVFWTGRVEERPFAAGQELQADAGARARRALDGKEADGE